MKAVVVIMRRRKRNARSMYYQDISRTIPDQGYARSLVSEDEVSLRLYRYGLVHFLVGRLSVRILRPISCSQFNIHPDYLALNPVNFSVSHPIGVCKPPRGVETLLLPPLVDAPDTPVPRLSGLATAYEALRALKPSSTASDMDDTLVSKTRPP